MTWNRGHAVTKDGRVMVASNAQLFGSTDSILVTHIGKAKKQDADAIERIRIVIPQEVVEEYMNQTADWLYEDFGPRLFHPSCNDPATWPKSYLCKDIWYKGWTCPYMPICENPQGDYAAFYETGRVIDPAALEKPKDLEKQIKKAAKAMTKVEGK